MRRETRTEELKVNRQFLLIALVKTRVKATWMVCVALCILVVTKPSTSVREETYVSISASILQLSSQFDLCMVYYSWNDMQSYARRRPMPVAGMRKGMHG
jgi:hypothetical protein